VVSVRKMAVAEADAVHKHAEKGGPSSSALLEALAAHPESVRIVHIGAEYLGAFVLTELKGGVEEVSGISLTEEGLKTGAERAVISYVLHAAKFARKKSVEVLAAAGSPEALHLEAEGFKASGAAEGGSRRFKIDVHR
jgi:hypothetical protein